MPVARGRLPQHTETLEPQPRAARFRGWRVSVRSSSSPYLPARPSAILKTPSFAGGWSILGAFASAKRLRILLLLITKWHGSQGRRANFVAPWHGLFQDHGLEERHVSLQHDQHTDQCGERNA